MPNHVISELIIRGVTSEMQESILAKVGGPERVIDFKNLLPPPLNIWNGSCGEKEEKAFPGTWYDWNTKNWGTKWNAYGLDDEEKYNPISQDGDTLTLTFQTAWAPPMGWIVALFNYFKIDIEHNWLDEGAERGHSDRFVTNRGEPFGGPGWIEEEATDAMQRHLHFLLWGVEEFEEETEDTDEK